MLQHLSFETPSSYYKDNILELEKSIGDSFGSATKEKFNNNKVQSLIQPKRLFEDDRTRNLNTGSKENSYYYSNFPSFNPNECSISSPITPRSKGNIVDLIEAKFSSDDFQSSVIVGRSGI